MEHREVEPGLVRQIPYKTKPLRKSLSIDNPHLSFHKNTSRVVRFDKLADSILTTSNRINERYLTLMVVGKIRDAIKKGTMTKGVDCTIVDGTSWYDAKATDKPKFGIRYANVHWEDDHILLVVMLGYQQTHKTSKLFYMPDGAATPVIVRFKLSETTVEVSNRVTDYLNRRNYDPVSYQDSSLVMYALAGCFNPMVEYPVAAATLLDGTVWFADRPYRHHHVIHSPEYLSAKKLIPQRYKPEEREVQGFLTNHGNFVHRKRAMYMAARCGMVLNSDGCVIAQARMKNTLHGGVIQEYDIHYDGMMIVTIDLFSEDLW